jgi:hypothetical protein
MELPIYLFRWLVKFTGYLLDSYGSEWGPVAGFFEYDNEPSGSTKDGTFFYQLSESKLLKKESTPWNFFSSKQPSVAVDIRRTDTVPLSYSVANVSNRGMVLLSFQKVTKAQSLPI